MANKNRRKVTDYLRLVNYINIFGQLKNFILQLVTDIKFEIKSLIKKSRNLKSTNIELGKSYFNEASMQDALVRFYISNKIWPNEPEILKYLGLVYWFKYNVKNAEKYWSNHQKIAPDEEIGSYLKMTNMKEEINFIPENILNYRKNLFKSDFLIRLSEKDKININNHVLNIILSLSGEEKSEISNILFNSKEFHIFEEIIGNDNEKNIVNFNNNYSVEEFENFSRQVQVKYDLIVSFCDINFTKDLYILGIFGKILAKHGKILLYLPYIEVGEKEFFNSYFRYTKPIVIDIIGKFNLIIQNEEVIKLKYEKIILFICAKKIEY